MPNIVSRTIRKEIWQSVYTLWDARKEGKILDKEHWQKYVPISVVTSLEYKVTVFWNQQLQTEKTIPNNKPDIVIRDNEKGTCMLIDSAIKKGMWSSKKTKRFKNLKTLQYKYSTCGVWSDIRNNNRFIFKHSQNTCKPRNQGTTENSHIVRCTHTAESVDVRYKNFWRKAALNLGYHKV